MQNQTADVTWNAQDVPVSTRFDDPYFSLDDGAAETHHVFLDGNDLPARFAPGFHIAELGFGTGLNLLVAWNAWVRAGQAEPLRFTSFELYPLSCDDMARALARHPQFDGRRDALLAAWSPEQRHVSLPGLEAEIVHGDARETLPDWPGRADAWFLDGFSPAKNPELWSPDLMRAVAQRTAQGGTVATYSAAGFVRRGLSDAGFDVRRVQGYGRKRHMTRGTLR
ncbi:tRNA (5-methylaminomethyl-2-thiouridine)(34)-methyltransferase MnmD [Sulfitobacter sabulilitoris]|uniref:FAD-dependent oxidoreductase n=1 Tax=Sulfitobacter sabulilitoris TaxID=2562655 RepID=A0A5S3PFM9_9RHOB|nr:tRNA (5-methylaminomethyl-2-thiouridine)(34)-methyltransferase MnmD [Sulfitobacter sabulilitoris]TMM52809.1 FAD-dependent oxidoreductase [Sulfitobacter sabulilitoris]